MNTRTIAITFLTLLIGLGAFASKASAADEHKDELDKLQERFKTRYAEVLKQKRAKVLGETDTGYIEAVDPKSVDGKEKEEVALKKLVDDENKDRKRLYEIIAEQQSTEDRQITAEQVAQRSAVRNFQRAEVGMFLKRKGNWVEKQPKKEGESEE